jgi:TRAP-type C4-dicarboxylate transport system permease small subunit
MIEISNQFFYAFLASIAAGALLFFFVPALNDGLEKLEGILLTLILILMIGLAFAQVVLRNFFNTGIEWGDAFVRHLVLWVGFIGASVATKEGGHLAMDLVHRFLPQKLRKPTAMFVDAASAFVCALLALASYKFYLTEKEAGTMLMPHVPNSWAVVIIPIGFYLMALRFAVKIPMDIRQIFQPTPPQGAAK